MYIYSIKLYGAVQLHQPYKKTVVQGSTALFCLERLCFPSPTYCDYHLGWWGGALGYFLGGYVPPGTPNWHPVLKKIPLKLIPCSRNGPIFYTPFQTVCKLKQPCFLKRYFFICSTYTSNKCFFIISNNFKQKIKP